MTARPAAVLVLFDGTITSANVIPFPLEIIRMASGAKARVNRVAVALNDLAIVLVTRYTPYV